MKQWRKTHDLTTKLKDGEPLPPPPLYIKHLKLLLVEKRTVAAIPSHVVTLMTRTDQESTGQRV